MVKLLSKELQSSSIRVNAICPGLIKTNFSKSLYEGQEEKRIQEMAVNRLGVPSDIANMVSFVASPEADYITGESFLVAGRASSRFWIFMINIQISKSLFA